MKFRKDKLKEIIRQGNSSELYNYNSGMGRPVMNVTQNRTLAEQQEDTMQNSMFTASNDFNDNMHRNNNEMM